MYRCNILICRGMQKQIQHNKDERTQFFRKIYLSLYSKGFERVTKGIICERWVGDWTELQHIDPRFLLATAAFLSRSPGLLNKFFLSLESWATKDHLIAARQPDIEIVNKKTYLPKSGLCRPGRPQSKIKRKRKEW